MTEKRRYNKGKYETTFVLVLWEFESYVARGWQYSALVCFAIFNNTEYQHILSPQVSERRTITTTVIIKARKKGYTKLQRKLS